MTNPNPNGKNMTNQEFFLFHDFLFLFWIRRNQQISPSIRGQSCVQLNHSPIWRNDFSRSQTPSLDLPRVFLRLGQRQLLQHKEKNHWKIASFQTDSLNESTSRSSSSLPLPSEQSLLREIYSISHPDICGLRDVRVFSFQRILSKRVLLFVHRIHRDPLFRSCEIEGEDFSLP